MPGDFFKHLIENAICIMPSFLFALFVSAILAEVLPDSFYEKSLGSKKFVSVVFASVIGALVPLCTCGMIPLASRLQKKGASWLIVISFLTSGNACSITAIFLTLILGFKITLIRFLFSVLCGILVSYFFVSVYGKTLPLLNSDKTIQCNDNLATLPVRIIREFVNLIFNFGIWVLIAIFIGTCISLYIKPETISEFAGIKNILSSFLFSIVGFPFYFCAGTDIPISKVLIEKGASIGSVLAFMTASGGINLTSLIIYQRWLGIKNAMIYLAISFLVCGVLGLIVNVL